MTCPSCHKDSEGDLKIFFGWNVYYFIIILIFSTLHKNQYIVNLDMCIFGFAASWLIQDIYEF